MESSSLEAFKARYQSQLEFMGFPEHLYESLKKKLEEQVYDIGDFMQMVYDEEDETTFAIATKNIKKEQDVYLIDHAWTFRPHGFTKTLRENEALRVRMYKMMYGAQDKKDLPAPRPSLMEEQKKWTEETTEITLDEVQIASLKFMELPAKLVTLSLWGNEINSLEETVDLLKTLPNLKALWLNNNPVTENKDFYSEICTASPQLELLNSEFTEQVGEWGILYLARKQIPKPNTLKEIAYLDLSGRAI